MREIFRQASEQNFTSFQLSAQRLRQAIGRPHAAQILLGNERLLPLNETGVKAIAVRGEVKLQFFRVRIPSRPTVKRESILGGYSTLVTDPVFL